MTFAQAGSKRRDYVTFYSNSAFNIKFCEIIQILSSNAIIIGASSNKNVHLTRGLSLHMESLYLLQIYKKKKRKKKLLKILLRTISFVKFVLLNFKNIVQKFWR